MTWVLFGMIAAVCDSLKGIIDKWSVVGHEKTLDSIVASFYRNGIFLFLCFAIGLSGIFGELQLFVTWPIVLLGFSWTAIALLYDHLLRNMEASRFGAMRYSFPFFLLVCETFFFDVQFSLEQIIAIALLVLGSILISLDLSGVRVRQLFSKHIWGYLFLYFCFHAALLFAYQYYATTSGINEISFWSSIWIYTVLGLFILVFYKKKQSLLWKTAHQNKLAIKAIASKFFDLIGHIFLYKAILLSTVTTASTLQSFSPFITLFLLVLLHFGGIHLREDLSRRNMLLKLLAIVLVCSGGIILIQTNT